MTYNEATDWLLSETAKGKMHWRRVKGGLREFSADLVLLPAYKVNKSYEDLPNVYIGLRGREKKLCLVITDKKRNWHFHDIEGDLKGIEIRKKFHKFFPGRHT